MSSYDMHFYPYRREEMTYNLELHVIVSSIDGHTGGTREDSIEEGIVGETGLVETRVGVVDIQ